MKWKRIRYRYIQSLHFARRPNSHPVISARTWSTSRASRVSRIIDDKRFSFVWRSLLYATWPPTNCPCGIMRLSSPEKLWSNQNANSMNYSATHTTTIRRIYLTRIVASETIYSHKKLITSRNIKRNNWFFFCPRNSARGWWKTRSFLYTWNMIIISLDFNVIVKPCSCYLFYITSVWNKIEYFSFSD